MVVETMWLPPGIVTVTYWLWKFKSEETELGESKWHKWIPSEKGLVERTRPEKAASGLGFNKAWSLCQIFYRKLEAILKG